MQPQHKLCQVDWMMKNLQGTFAHTKERGHYLEVGCHAQGHLSRKLLRTGRSVPSVGCCAPPPSCFHGELVFTACPKSHCSDWSDDEKILQSSDTQIHIQTRRRNTHTHTHRHTLTHTLTKTPTHTQIFSEGLDNKRAAYSSLFGANISTGAIHNVWFIRFYTPSNILYFV